MTLKYGLVFIAINAMMAAGFATLVNISSKRMKDLVVQIGKVSYTIYLLHQFAAGIVVRVLDQVDKYDGKKVSPCGKVGWT